MDDTVYHATKGLCARPLSGEVKAPPAPIVIPAAKRDIYEALCHSYGDMKALERVRELVQSEACEDCLSEIDKQVERAHAVADAMAKLLKASCEICHKRHYLGHIACYEVATGKCGRCGAPIVLASEAPAEQARGGE